MGSAERRERERQEVRTVILDGARAIMNERGFDGLTMRAVADRIEYSPAAIYKHFADREDLVAQLCANDFYAFNQAMSAHRQPADTRDPLEALRAIGRGYAEFALKFPEQYRVMFMTPLPTAAQVDETARAPGKDAYASLVEAVAIAHAQGHFAGLDVHLIAQTMWATMHGVVSLAITHLCVDEPAIPFAPLAERVETALQSVLLGLEALGAQKRGAQKRTAQKRTAPKRATSRRRR